MRNGEARLVDLLVPVDEQVEVDRPRAEARALPRPAEPPLDVEEAVEELARPQLRVDRRRRVEEARLVGVSDGVRLALGRHGDDLNARLGPKRVERGRERAPTIADVCAHPHIRTCHVCMVTISVRRLSLVAVVGALAAVVAGPAGATSLLLSDHALLALKDSRGAGLVRANGGVQVSDALRL